jgi:hypothetical protein
MSRAAGDVVQSEFRARGDRVALRVWLPAASAGPAPLCVMLGGGESSDSSEVDTAATEIARFGVTAASWDLPLCGARRSPKLSELLWAAARNRDPRPEQRMLVEEVLRQAEAELGAALDHLATWPEIDTARIAAIGSELAAPVIALRGPRDERICGIAIGPLELPAFPLESDPQRAKLHFASRPLVSLGPPPNLEIDRIRQLIEAAFRLPIGS